MPRRQWNDGMELVYGDLSAASSSLEMELYDRIIYEMMNRQQNVTFGDSFYVSYTNGTHVSVKKGSGMQYDATQVDPEPMSRPLYLSADTAQTLTAPDGVNPRIDIVCVKANRVTASTQSRNFKDPSSGLVAPQAMIVETDWLSDLQVVAGTPAVSPAVPATPAGWIKLAELLVSAVTGIANQAAITDKRVVFGKSSSWVTTRAMSVNDSITLNDELILANASGASFIAILPPIASSVGKKIIIIKIDSSANTVTLDGNAAEIISGELTQVMAAQWTALTVVCDGTQWYLI